MPHSFGRWPLRRVRVRGPSMAPTLSDGDVLLASRFSRPREGAVALVRWPSRPGQLSVKRLARRDDGDWHALGDNPHGSTDSRQLGAAVVVGVAWCRLWPRPGRLRRPGPGRRGCGRGPGGYGDRSCR